MMSHAKSHRSQVASGSASRSVFPWQTGLLRGPVMTFDFSTFDL